MSALRVGLAAEDERQHRAVTQVIDLRIAARHAWFADLEPELRDGTRSIRGAVEHTPYLKLTSNGAVELPTLTRLESGERIHLHGRIQGESLKPEASMWRRVLLAFVHATHRPDAVILARDTDRHPKRESGLEQACEGFTWPFPVVSAVGRPEIEAWFIVGFDAEDEHERSDFADAKGAWAYDPTSRPERIPARGDRDDAKAILDILCDGDRDREDRCLSLAVAKCATTPAPAAVEHVGLADFVRQVDRVIVPLI